MIDSQDPKSVSEASEMLYDILNNLNVLEKKIPILVCCNKQDLFLAKKPSQVQLEMERDIEELRKVRRAIQDDQDTAKENVKKAGYLEQARGPKKFKFN
mmetsp:Transcript_11176/g.18787  ORF Transcript_11176/g.18787 Transcript_11176/m.18787 type:complete len:99 (-) Transcript_11176:130-426(-)